MGVIEFEIGWRLFTVLVLLVVMVVAATGSERRR